MVRVEKDYDEYCTFCSEIHNLEAGNIFNSYIASEEFPNRVVWENDLYVLLAGIGAFVVGYFILIPRQHIPSYAFCTLEQFLQLNSIASKILSEFKAKGLGYTLFEHGSMTKIGEAGCCVNHAHLHFIPRTVNLNSSVRKKFNVKPIDKFSLLEQNMLSKIPYILYTNNNIDIYSVDAPILPSQYLRQIVTRELGCPHLWNWKTKFNLEKMKLSYELGKSIMKDYEVL